MDLSKNDQVAAKGGNYLSTVVCRNCYHEEVILISQGVKREAFLNGFHECHRCGCVTMPIHLPTPIVRALVKGSIEGG